MVQIQNRNKPLKTDMVWFGSRIQFLRTDELNQYIFLTIYLFIISHIYLFNVLNSIYAYSISMFKLK
jgi:hypothetical protein